MRLTADVILHARAAINPCDERELDLRGYKIPMIENLGVTQDQFDAIDFSDNEIKKLDNFPRYKRLSSLLLCNNHVSRIATDLGTQLPNLSCLILTNNKLSTLADLEGLRTCKKLAILSLMHNEVVNKQYYRLYAINLVPSLKQLDFQKVTLKEREEAGRLARSQAGQVMRKDVAQEAVKAKIFTPGKPAAAEQKLTDEHRAIYAERIAKATTVEEVEMLSRKIQAGIIPSATYKIQTSAAGAANGSAPPAVAATSGIAPSGSGGRETGGGGREDGAVAGSKDDGQSGPASEEKASETVEVVPPTKTAIEAAVAAVEVATEAAGEIETEVQATKPSSDSADGGEIDHGSPDDEDILRDALGDDGDANAEDDEEALKGAPAPAPTDPAAAEMQGVEEMAEAKAEAVVGTSEAEAKEKAEEGAEGAGTEKALPTTSSMDVEKGHGEVELSAAATEAAADKRNGNVEDEAPEDGSDLSSAGAGDAMVVENGGNDEREEKEQESAAMDVTGGAEAGDVGGEAKDSEQDGEKEVAEAAEQEQEEEGAGDMEQEEEGAGEPKLSEAQIKKFKVVDLKKELVELDLPTNGLKADLQARLLAAMGY